MPTSIAGTGFSSLSETVRVPGVGGMTLKVAAVPLTVGFETARVPGVLAGSPAGAASALMPPVVPPEGSGGVSNGCGGSASNSALTSVSVPRVRWQNRLPEQPPPDQPAKAEPGAGTAVRVTSEPALYSAAQASPQSIPEGSEVTAPSPEPALATLRAWAASVGPKASRPAPSVLPLVA